MFILTNHSLCGLEEVTSGQFPGFIFVDLFDDFLRYWEKAKDEHVLKQVELWHTQYMSNHIELFNKQIEDYQNQGMDWREIAKEKILPFLEKRLPSMKKARNTLLQICGLVYFAACENLGLHFSPVFVIHVGLGCGAGWATQYQGQPAVLFGLENIAESGWVSRGVLEGLAAHELGHLAHTNWRIKELIKTGEDPLILLYTEGFAQRCEHLILGRQSWHQSQSKDWVEWCQQHRGWLAKEYLRRIRENIPVNQFFGSWLDLHGKKQTGYYLGHEFIRWLERDYDTETIAKISTDKVRELGTQYLKKISLENTSPAIS